MNVSLQECIPTIMAMEIGFWDGLGEIVRRSGPHRRRMGVYQRDIWPCKDGHLGFRVLGGDLGAATLRGLVEWMDAENMAGPLKGIDLESLDMAKVTQAEVDNWEEALCQFFRKHTSEEIYKRALEKQMLICPGYTPKDLMEYEQLRERDFWDDVQYPELEASIRHPSGLFKSSETRCQIRRRAPLIGEHNEEIYGQELGISKQELVRLKEEGII